MKKKAKSQLDRLAVLLVRFGGATSAEICRAIGTVSPHRRIADLKAVGWRITKRETKRAGCKFVYFGKAPKRAARVSP
ncbi:MAG: helix-turn-helix domain-containing protein [Burkholderiaceae bacterium]